MNLCACDNEQRKHGEKGEDVVIGRVRSRGQYGGPLSYPLSANKKPNYYTCDGSGCVTEYVWGTCVELSPGYLYD